MAQPLVTDALWERLRPLLPARPEPKRPDCPGRPPIQDRQALIGVWKRFVTNRAIAALKPVKTAFRESRLRPRSDVPVVIRSRGVTFAVGRRSRTHSAFGASVTAGDGVSE
jgi:hypothetical protein